MESKELKKQLSEIPDDAMVIIHGIIRKWGDPEPEIWESSYDEKWNQVSITVLYNEEN